MVILKHHKFLFYAWLKLKKHPKQKYRLVSVTSQQLRISRVSREQELSEEENQVEKVQVPVPGE